MLFIVIRDKNIYYEYAVIPVKDEFVCDTIIVKSVIDLNIKPCIFATAIWLINNI